MKKLFAILAAVALAFLLAMGDELYKSYSQSGRLDLNSIRTAFGLSGTTTDTGPSEKPKLPAIISVQEKEAPLSFDERMKKGDYYREKGFYAFAANEYAKASNLAPDRLAPYQRLAEVNFELAEYKKSKTNLERVLKMDPQNIEAQYLLIRVAIKESDLKNAVEKIDIMAQNGITDPRLNFLKALVAIAEGRHSDGKSLLTKAKADPLADADLRAKIDTLLSGYQEFDFAQGAEDLYLGELLSRGLNQIGEYELAVYKLKEILKTRNDLRDAWNLLGFAYLNLQNPLFAATAFEQAYKIDPQLPATQYFLGLAYSEVGKNDDAIVYLNYALRNGFQPKAVAERKVADLYLDQGEYSKAAEAYNDILKSNPQDVQAFVRPIWIYLEFLNQPEQALKLGESAVITFPQSAMSYNLLGWSQYGTKNFVESEKNLLKAIQMDPKLAAAHYNLGKLYEEQDEEAKALEHYQKAYNLDQNGSIGNLAAKRYNILTVE